jgi:hypothetical protein
MNQINIDSLLSIGSSTKFEPQLKLDPTQLYQALLKIGNDGSGQLQLSAGASTLKIGLSQPELQQLLRPQTTHSTQVNLSSAPAQPTLNANSLDGTQWQVKVQPLTDNTIMLALQKPSLKLPLNEIAVFQLLQQANSLQLRAASTNEAMNAPTLQLPVQLLRQQDRLLISIAANRPQLAVPISQFSDKQQALLGQIPIQNQMTGQPKQFGLLQLSLQNNQIQLSLQVSQPLTNNLVNHDANQSAPSIALAQPPLSVKVSSENYVSQALANKQGLTHFTDKLSSEKLSSEKINQPPVPTKQTASAHSATIPNQGPEAKTADVGTKGQQQDLNITSNGQSAKIALQFTREQSKALMPMLTKQLIYQSLSIQNQQLQVNAKALNSSATALSNEQWQLKPLGQQWQIEVQASHELHELKVPLKAFDKALQWQNITLTPTAKINSLATNVDIQGLWRQLLPMTSSLDPLRVTPELPANVQAFLQELKAHTVDHQKVPTAAELQSQLNATLQFSPLQSQPNALTAAGSMAIALQLLIGRLTATASDANRPIAGKEKLQQLIGQLNETQSGQLLKQLSSHSAQIQQAQFANIEQQNQTKTEHPQLFLQLPLLVDGRQQFVELAIGERDADGTATGSKKKAWQLTMKFQLPDQGHLLVQVHLIDTEVSMQFYAETEQTQQLASQWLPLFKDRLKVQGLDIKEIQVQRGKIPEHLYQRGTSLLQVKV